MTSPDDAVVAAEKCRWATPTGEPCPRIRRCDGTLEGSGDCVGCGFCLLMLAAAYDDNDDNDDIDVVS